MLPLSKIDDWTRLKVGAKIIDAVEEDDPRFGRITEIDKSVKGRLSILASFRGMDVYDAYTVRITERSRISGRYHVDEKQLKRKRAKKEEPSTPTEKHSSRVEGFKFIDV